MSAKLDRNESPLTASRYAGLRPVQHDGRLELPPREILRLPEGALGTLGEYYVVEEGDRIDQLAYHLLGDSRRWWLIADLNPTKITDPQRLPVGESIFIPYLEIASRFV